MSALRTQLNAVPVQTESNPDRTGLFVSAHTMYVQQETVDPGLASSWQFIVHYYNAMCLSLLEMALLLLPPLLLAIVLTIRQTTKRSSNMHRENRRGRGNLGKVLK